MSRHYDHAPITEAIIDLRAALPSPSGLDPIKTFASSIASSFPVNRPLSAVTMSFLQQDELEGKFLSAQQQVGLRLESSDAKRVLQVQQAGFTYSHMPPYSEWERFRDEAKELWLKYIDYAGSIQVTRLAVRVINKISVPGSMEDLPQFSNLVLRLPDKVPTAHTLFTQFQINGSCWVDGCRVVVNAGATPQPEKKLEILLDFDTFVEGTRDSISAEIWKILDRLSVAKDDLFEAFITDEIRRLIA